MDDIEDAEGAGAEGAEHGHGGDGPEDELEVEVVGDVGGGVGLGDGHGEHGVGHHPRDDHVRAHRAVVVFLLLGLADARAGHFEAVAQVAQRLVVAGVDVQLLAWHFELHGITLA